MAKPKTNIVVFVPSDEKYLAMLKIKFLQVLAKFDAFTFSLGLKIGLDGFFRPFH